MTRILATLAPAILLAMAGASFAGDMSERAGPLRLAAGEGGKAQASAPAPASAAKKEASAPSMKPAAAPKLNMDAPAKNPGPDTDLRNCLDRSTDREVIRCTEGKA
jgi:hypothetical protein